MSGYRRWVMSSQGAWAVAMVLLLVAAINFVSGDWLLGAAMAALAALNLGRAWTRLQNERAGA
ncbi:MAG TPA: hypothetical protein VGM80_08825 [Gaiellaceae bacterium]|jgi:hypothetical protein